MIDKVSQVKIVFVSAIIILLGLSVFSYIRIKNLVKASELVNHTTTVKLELENTFFSLTYVESNHRGFFLSRDSSFLKNLSQGTADLNVHLNTLDSLIKDNPSQIKNTDILRSLIYKRLDFLSSLLDDYKTDVIPAEKWLYGKTLMDDVRKHVTKMEREEEKLYITRSYQLNKESFFTPFFIVLLMIASIITLFVAYNKITVELKKSEILKSEIEKRKNELIKSNQSLEQKNQDLLQANKELESFAYISSHDLQEPLRKIQTFASRIMASEKDNLSETGKGYFERIDDSAERMRMLIEDLLTYSSASNVKQKPEKVDIGKLTEEVKNDFKELLDEQKGSIDVSGLTELKVIPFQFRQLLQNLISNAIKFSKPGVPPHIIITSSIVKGNSINAKVLPQADYCHIKISDNGIGFDPQYKERIFEVFKRLHGKEQYKGTGIGLAIVKKIVDNHNGFIFANGELNKGASFDIYIPVS